MISRIRLNWPQGNNQKIKDQFYSLTATQKQDDRIKISRKERISKLCLKRWNTMLKKKNIIYSIPKALDLIKISNAILSYSDCLSIHRSAIFKKVFWANSYVDVFELIKRGTEKQNINRQAVLDPVLVKSNLNCDQLVNIRFSDMYYNNRYQSYTNMFSENKLNRQFVTRRCSRIISTFK